MADLADLRVSRPKPPKLNATDKKIQTIIKDVEVCFVLLSLTHDKE